MIQGMEGVACSSWPKSCYLPYFIIIQILDVFWKYTNRISLSLKGMVSEFERSEEWQQGFFYAIFDAIN